MYHEVALILFGVFIGYVFSTVLTAEDEKSFQPQAFRPIDAEFTPLMPGEDIEIDTVIDPAPLEVDYEALSRLFDQAEDETSR